MTADDLLGPWRQEGRWDSEGGFTLDPAQALQKLRAFALEDPRRYILGLVSWAVASKAVSIDVVAKAGRMEVSVPGVSLGSGELAGLFGDSGLSHLASRELAVATITASGLANAKVTVFGSDACLVVDSKGFVLQPHQGADVVWRLDEPRSLFGWVGRVLGDESLEVPLLRELCAHADVPITINGAPVYRPIELPRLRKAIHLTGPALPIEPEQLAGNDIEIRPSPGPFSVMVAASTTPILRTRALYIVRGVSFEMPPVEHYGENFVVVVNAPELTKDLSGRGLVGNEECQRIQVEVAKLAQELWQSP